MTITLFRPFPDPYRQSMHLYADQLRQGLAAILGPDDAVRDCSLPGAHVSPPWVRYWDQYVRYQRRVRGSATDVNHIVDHGYGHLARSLPLERTVVTFHDAVVTKVPGVSLRTKMSLRHSLRAIRGVARVITDSHASREDFLELVDYEPDHVVVVPPGVAAAFRPRDDRDALRRALGFTRPTILHVGHTQSYMNLPAVIRVVDRLVRALGVDVELVRVGGALEPSQQALVDRLGLASRLRSLGRLPLDRLAEVYAAVDVVLYPPLHAGFGLPPLEAMACGTPVVCSNRGSLPEVIGDAAPTLDPADEAGIAAAVARLLSDADARERARLSGLRQASRFTWDATARGALRVYREIVRA